MSNAPTAKLSAYDNTTSTISCMILKKTDPIPLEQVLHVVVGILPKRNTFSTTDHSSATCSTFFAAYRASVSRIWINSLWSLRMCLSSLTHRVLNSSQYQHGNRRPQLTSECCALSISLSQSSIAITICFCFLNIWQSSLIYP